MHIFGLYAQRKSVLPDEWCMPRCRDTRTRKSPELSQSLRSGQQDLRARIPDEGPTSYGETGRALKGHVPRESGKTGLRYCRLAK